MWWTIGIGAGILLLLPLGFTIWVLWTYAEKIYRIFEHKPMFFPAKEQAHPDAESVEFATSNGRKLRGSYLSHTNGARRGVILFCHEFTADRWLAVSYLGPLLEFGYDIFTFDFCNHGESESIAGYEPLQWLTAFEVDDVRAAIKYLASRPDADPNGVGIFGVSKGGSAGIVAAAEDDLVRCVITDGAFPTHGTVTWYEMYWVEIYSGAKLLYRTLPRWFYALVTEYVVFNLQRRRRVKYARVERSMRRLQRPFLAIHGKRDTYIKAAIVRRLVDAAAPPKDLWIVEGAKHNACLDVAGDKYRSRIKAFFDEHLAGIRAPELDQPVEPVSPDAEPAALEAVVDPAP